MVAKDKEGAAAAAGAPAEPPKQKTDDHDVAGVGILSDEQTNAAMAALQEASTLVIQQMSAEEEFATTGASSANKQGDEVDAEQAKKRKATDDAEDLDKPPAKKRSTPMRVSWEDRLQQLREYKEQNGDLLIPIRYKQNKSLGKFVHNTREQYKLYHKKAPEGYKKKCSLTKERVEQLDALGFVWSTERTKKQNDDWEKRLEQLKEYKKKHGDCNVPHAYSDPSNPGDRSFAEWIHRQRTAYAAMLKSKKPNELVKQRMEKLKEVGFYFTVHTDKWMDHYKELQEYKEKNGHVQVPTHYAENPKLGRWVHTQRHQHRLQVKGKKTCITKERIDLLNKLEFSWEVRPSLERPRATWQQRFEELKEFYAKNQNFRVPSATHSQLQFWVNEQKLRLKNLEKNGKDTSKRMGPDRVRLLNELGFTKDSDTTDTLITPAGKVPSATTTLPAAEAVDTSEAAREPPKEASAFV